MIWMRYSNPPTYTVVISHDEYQRRKYKKENKAHTRMRIHTHALPYPALFHPDSHLYSDKKGPERDKQQHPNFTREK